MEQDVAMPHNDVKPVMIVGRREECANHCFKEPQCLFWTFHYGVGTGNVVGQCWLKRTDAGRQSWVGRVSGNKACGR